MSAAPVASAAAKVNLVGTIELLHTHLTVALCHTVFQRVRDRERQRRWTLAALAQFWLTVILTAPRSLTQALQDGGVLIPRLGPAARTTPEAFFQRAERLRLQFFQALYEAFIARGIVASRFGTTRRCAASRWGTPPSPSASWKWARRKGRLHNSCARSATQRAGSRWIS